MRNGSFLPTAWKRGSLLNEFLSDFDSLFPAVSEAATRDWGLAKSTLGAVDIEEGEKAFFLKVDVPGFTKEQIKVDVIGDRLTIKAEKDEEAKKDDKTYHLRERNYRGFQRVFNLGERAHYEGISAKYENGVLSLEIPKKEVAQQKTITIS